MSRPARGIQQPEGLGAEDCQETRHKRSCVAVARRLAVIMHAMWRDGTEFRFKQPHEAGTGAVRGCPMIEGVAA